MILVIVGRRAGTHFFRREEGIGSRSQLISGDSLICLEISVKETG